MQISKCPLCATDAELYPRTRDGEEYNCPKCGKYFISGTALAMLQYDDVKPLIVDVTQWLQVKYASGENTPEITSEVLWLMSENNATNKDKIK